MIDNSYFRAIFRIVKQMFVNCPHCPHLLSDLPLREKRITLKGKFQPLSSCVSTQYVPCRRATHSAHAPIACGRNYPSDKDCMGKAAFFTLSNP